MGGYERFLGNEWNQTMLFSSPPSPVPALGPLGWITTFTPSLKSPGHLGASDQIKHWTAADCTQQRPGTCEWQSILKYCRQITCSSQTANYTCCSALVRGLTSPIFWGFIISQFSLLFSLLVVLLVLQTVFTFSQTVSQVLRCSSTACLCATSTETLDLFHFGPDLCPNSRWGK